MTNPMQARIEQAYAELDQQKNALSQLEGRVAAVRQTVVPKNRVVSVTVDGAGDLVEIKFPTKAYRTMAPAEFAQLLIDTIQQARVRAREAAAAELRALLPPGLPVLGALNGPVDIEGLFGEIGSLFGGPMGAPATERSA